MFGTATGRSTPKTLRKPRKTRSRTQNGFIKSKFQEVIPKAIAARTINIQKPPLPNSNVLSPSTASSASTTTATPRIVQGGNLSPSIKLRGAWALQRERSDHLQAELETKNVQLQQNKQLQTRLANEIRLRDDALERSRRCARQDQGTIELLSSQLDDLRSDLMTEREIARSTSRVHEDTIQENETAKQHWEIERHEHDHQQNILRETQEHVRETEEEVVKMHMLYDAVESERNELKETVRRMSSELQLLRHVKAQKEKNVVLLLKEKERLHRDLSKQKKRVSRRRQTTENLSQSKASAARTAQFEREKTHLLLSDLVGSASILKGSLKKSDRTLRERLGVLAAQVKKERDRNTELQKSVESEHKISAALRVRLRNR